ncbi:MAG: hypothetical protein ABIA97_02120 [Candidatus Omnitrophota bacterium]
MKRLLFVTLILILFSGCSLGRPSKTQGSAIFSIPFDFGYKTKEAMEEEKMIDDMIRLEAEMILDKELDVIQKTN